MQPEKRKDGKPRMNTRSKQINVQIIARSLQSKLTVENNIDVFYTSTRNQTHARCLFTSSTSNIVHPDIFTWILSRTSTFDELSFSSMTCLRIVRHAVAASLIVMLWNKTNKSNNIEAASKVMCMKTGARPWENMTSRMEIS